MKSFYAKWGGLLLAIILLGLLTFQHYQKDLAVVSPQEVLAQSSHGEVRLLGMVRGGTLQGHVDDGQAQFEVIDNDSAISVQYQGPPPDNLRELKVLVLIGTWNPTSQVFEARDIGLVTNYGYVLGAYFIGLFPLLVFIFGMSRKVGLLYAEIKESKLYQPE